MSTNLRIGELAQQAGCLVESVRYYEREGLLLEPARSKGNYRLYANVHVERLQFIRHCRSLDMTLEEIRNLLRFRDAPEANCGEVNALLDEHIEHVRNRLEELRFLQKNLRELRSLCAKTQATRDCGILQSLGSATTHSLRPSNVEHRNSHLHKTHKSSGASGFRQTELAQHLIRDLPPKPQKATGTFLQAEMMFWDDCLY